MATSPEQVAEIQVGNNYFVQLPGGRDDTVAAVRARWRLTGRVDPENRNVLQAWVARKRVARLAIWLGWS